MVCRVEQAAAAAAAAASGGVRAVPGATPDPSPPPALPRTRDAAQRQKEEAELHCEAGRANTARSR